MENPKHNLIRQLVAENDIELFLKHSSQKRFLAGEAFYQESVCNEVFFVQQGEMRIFRITEEGKEITLYRIGSGEICLLSLNAAVSPLPFSSSAVFERDSTLLVIPAEIYSGIFSRNVLLQQYVLELVMGKLNNVMTLSEEVAFHSLDKRIANKILTLGSMQNTASLRTTHEEIARDLGSAREVVSRVLKTFSEKGLIRKTRGYLEILDRDSLRKISCT